ncbi:MAG: hypothetical protein EYC68_11525 [Chloroflexota bacterium]|nr:MAG: hypothetical protein EYC68_11525 [Chloroflexota bacterium]
MEIELKELTELVADYLQAARSIPIQNPQERQGNSKLWEKDLENYFRGRGFDFIRNDNASPDFGEPLNVDIKTVRFDRTAKTFSVAPLTIDQAVSGVLPYRMIVLVWRYDGDTQRGYPVDALVVPKEAKTVLTNWSFKGIQVKSGVSESLLRERGILGGKNLKG